MAIMEEFHACSSRMDRIHWAYITLLPKTPGAKRVGDFRPISLSKSIYLIITKVLANRLRELLGTLISPLQSAFVLGRQMADSVVVAEEIIAAWRRSGTTSFAKAYDSLDWHFLWNVLKCRGFSKAWTNWMKQCVCTTTFAVLVNGRPQGGWIHPQQGIRQGCLLAPLLFILAADTLAISTEQLCIRNYLTGFQTTGRPGGIPLLQYADDTTFFIRGLTVAAHHVSTMLDIFSDYSGLQLNRSKSSAIGIGLDSEELAWVSAVLCTPVASLPIRYLRLFLAEGRPCA